MKMFTPAIIKILKYLKENRLRRTKEELALVTEEAPEYINQALAALDTAGLVKLEGDFYTYQAIPANEELFNQLLEVYQLVSQKPAQQLLIRGLICQIPSQYLFHAATLLGIFEEEGIELEELQQFLASEIEEGYLKKARIIYIGLDPSFIPICIPPYYLHYLYHLGFVDQDSYFEIRQKYPKSQFHEEDYFIAQYPAELATPAKEYLERERGDLKEMLRHKALSSWREGWWRLRYI
jgi:hypothetical protein